MRRRTIPTGHETVEYYWVAGFLDGGHTELAISLDEFAFIKPLIEDTNVLTLTFDNSAIVLWDRYRLENILEVLKKRNIFSKEKIAYFVD